MKNTRPEAATSSLFMDNRKQPEAPKLIKCNIHFLPAVCKAGSMDIVFLKKIRCKRCGAIFYVCRSCFRGQVYCGDRCRKASQDEAHRESERRYRQTDKGRETHRQGEKRRRMRKNKKNKKTVDDETTTPPLAFDNMDSNLPGTEIKCHFCGAYGIVVKHFPRRGYGGRLYPSEDIPDSS